MHSAFHPVGLKSKVNVSVLSIMHVVLVEHVIQALIKVLKVKQDHCSPSLHANLYLINVSTHLYTCRNMTQFQTIIICNIDKIMLYLSVILVLRETTAKQGEGCSSSVFLFRSNCLFMLLSSDIVLQDVQSSIVLGQEEQIPIFTMMHRTCVCI